MIGPLVLILRVMLALALYAFLALALRMLWQDIKQTGLAVAGHVTPSIRLKIHNKKRRALFQEFSQSDVTLGRDPQCDVPLADKSVSARQARLSFRHAHWWLEDLKSANGTRLNHQKLSRPTVLIDGDEIEFGQVRVVVSSTSRSVQSEALGLVSHDG